MHCQRVREKFVDFLDGDARRTEHIIVQVHVAQCPACRRALQETKALMDQSREALAHPEPRDRFPQLMERIATEDAQHGFHWPRVWAFLASSNCGVEALNSRISFKDSDSSSSLPCMDL